jgi:tetratricopeptide (TPR) repeat protein
MNAKQSTVIVLTGWIFFGVGIALMCLSLFNVLFFIPVFFVAFVLSIIAMCKSRVFNGVALMLCILIIPGSLFFVLGIVRTTAAFEDYHAAERLWETRATAIASELVDAEVMFYASDLFAEAVRLAEQGNLCVADPEQGETHYEEAFEKYARAVKVAEEARAAALNAYRQAEKDWDARGDLSEGIAVNELKLFAPELFNEASKQSRLAAATMVDLPKGTSLYQRALKTYIHAVESAKLNKVLLLQAYYEAAKKWEERDVPDDGITGNDVRSYFQTGWDAANQLADEAADLSGDPERGVNLYELALNKYMEAEKLTRAVMYPEMDVVCSVANVSVEIVPVGGSEVVLPVSRDGADVWVLNKDGRYRLTVSHPDSKTYSEDFEASWKGFSEKQVQLEMLFPGSDIRIDLPERHQIQFVWDDALNGWCGKYEVSNQEYRHFMSEHDSGQYNDANTLNRDQQPVVNVSWLDAQEYIAWMEKSCELPRGYKLTLPTGEEWMAVAQCGQYYTYPWGNDWPPKGGNYQDWPRPGKRLVYKDGHTASCDVADSWQNPHGVYGLAGNVWEWTNERFGPNSCVLRGGSWNTDDRIQMQCDYREKDSTARGSKYYGFRLFLCREPQED